LFNESLKLSSIALNSIQIGPFGGLSKIGAGLWALFFTALTETLISYPLELVFYWMKYRIGGRATIFSQAMMSQKE